MNIYNSEINNNIEQGIVEECSLTQLAVSLILNGKIDNLEPVEAIDNGVEETEARQLDYQINEFIDAKYNKDGSLKNPKLRDTYTWSISILENFFNYSLSMRFINLDKLSNRLKGDTKLFFDNFIKPVLNSLSEEQKNVYNNLRIKLRDKKSVEEYEFQISDICIINLFGDEVENEEERQKVKELINYILEKIDSLLNNFELNLESTEIQGIIEVRQIHLNAVEFLDDIDRRILNEIFFDNENQTLSHILDKEQREILRMHYLEKKTYRQIDEMLEQKSGYSNKILGKALRTIRTNYGVIKQTLEHFMR